MPRIVLMRTGTQTRFRVSDGDYVINARHAAGLRCTGAGAGTKIRPRPRPTHKFDAAEMRNSFGVTPVAQRGTLALDANCILRPVTLFQPRRRKPVLAAVPIRARISRVRSPASAKVTDQARRSTRNDRSCEMANLRIFGAYQVYVCIPLENTRRNYNANTP